MSGMAVGGGLSETRERMGRDSIMRYVAGRCGKTGGGMGDGSMMRGREGNRVWLWWCLLSRRLFQRLLVMPSDRRVDLGYMRVIKCAAKRAPPRNIFSICSGGEVETRRTTTLDRGCLRRAISRHLPMP